MKKYLMAIFALSFVFGLYASNIENLGKINRQVQIDEMLDRASVVITNQAQTKLIKGMSECIQHDNFHDRLRCMDALVNTEIAKIEEKRNFRIAVFLFIVSCCSVSGGRDFGR